MRITQWACSAYTLGLLYIGEMRKEGDRIHFADMARCFVSSISSWLVLMVAIFIMLMVLVNAGWRRNDLSPPPPPTPNLMKHMIPPEIWNTPPPN